MTDIAMRILPLLMLSAWLVAGLPEVAQGSIVTVDRRPDPAAQPEVRYLADPGERNDVTLREIQAGFPSGAVWEVRDTGASVRALRGCTSVDAHTARCAADLFSDVPGSGGGYIVGGFRARLGDENDTLRTFSMTGDNFAVRRVVLYGGTGDDVLYGGDAVSGDGRQFHGARDPLFGGDRLDGGGGRDELHGEGGVDLLSDGDRTDGIGDPAPGRDVLDGGPGQDTVSYGQRRAPVSVDLGRMRAGEPGERDVLSDIESIDGGHGDDRLTGDAMQNWLDGGRGRDRLIGRGGEDHLRSGELVACGSGRDIVHRSHYPRAARLGFLRDDCDWIEMQEQSRLPPYPERTGRDAVIYRVGCPFGGEDDEQRQECSGNLRLSEPAGRRRLLARGSFRRGTWRPRDLRARLTPLGRFRLSGGAGARADVAFSGYGFVGPVRWTIHLGARG